MVDVDNNWVGGYVAELCSGRLVAGTYEIGAPGWTFMSVLEGSLMLLPD